MNYSNQVYEIALHKLNGIGIKRAQHILTKMPLSDFFELNKKTLHDLTGFSLNFINKLNFKSALIEAEKEVDELNKKNISFSFYGNETYPARLKNCYDPPLILYHYGNGNVAPKKIVSIVGSRNASIAGKKATECLVDQLSNNNISVVSGLAYGIDICAHKKSLKNNNETIAVLAHGFNFIYPHCHRNIAKEITNNGLLISEHSINTPPNKAFFPKRNRIIAGLSDATIIVESKKNGGAIITARMANDYNRDVFAYPGETDNPLKEGCNKLIQNNQAHLITSCSDFLKFMNWDNNIIQNENNPVILNKIEKTLFDIIDKNNAPIGINKIKSISGISVKDAQLAVFSLELKVLINPGPGQTFCA